jgi:SAM-dependent methyltransferase
MTRISACRACGGPRLAPILDLGSTPLANALPTADRLGAPEPVFPLDLVLCRDCSLLQITETVPPEQLFSDYLYFSSFSDSFLRHAEAIATRLVAERRLGPGSLVAEVASNDGYLLQFYKRAGVPVLGIEPAANIAKVAREERGIDTLNAFFGTATAQQLRDQGRRADVVHANNVLAHVADLTGFVRGFALLLKDDGVAVLESPYIKPFLDHCEFDTIYHEHLCYYSLTALDRLFRSQGLLIRAVEHLPVHGGSIRLFAEPLRPGRSADASVTTLLAAEAAWGVTDPAAYQAFARTVATLKADLRRTLGELKAQGKRIAAYGAAAKGSTLLNAFGIGTETLDFVADRSTYKQGRFMPGVHLPIHSPERILTDQPDYLLILAWNFADEIMKQQAEYQRRGGRFIIPIPTVRIV